MRPHLVLAGTAALVVPCLFTSYTTAALAGGPVLAVTTGITIYVDDDAPNDPGPNDPNVSDPLEYGSAEHPFDRVQEALDVALPADLVQILPGVYTQRMDVPVSGCQIAGSGTGQTLVRQPSGQVLNAGWLGYESYQGPPPTLIVRDLSLVGSIDIFNFRFSLQPPFTFIAFERVILTGDLSIDGWSSEGRMTDVTTRKGRILFSTSNSAYNSLTLSSVDAPDTVITMLVNTAEASSSLTVSDSTLSGISSGAHYNAHGTRIHARNTRFTGDGLSSSSGSACLHQVVIENCVFERGGIHVGDLSAGYSVCNNSFGRTSVRRSRFLGAGITYDAEFGYQDNSLPGDFLIELDANRFSGAGISASLVHGFVSSTGSAALRITNNIFESGGPCLVVSWGVNNTDPSDLPADFRLEVVNNTFVECGTGLSLMTNSHPPGLNTHTDVIANNIIEGGSIGLSINGIVDHDLSIVGNNIHGQRTGTYAGDLPDQTGINGNISADPRFLDPNAGDYSLRHDSPCIDSGRPGPAVPATDHDGTGRPLDGDGDGVAASDMGAFEFVLLDADGDGFPAGIDCNDGDASIHPGAPDLPGNAVDEDCDSGRVCDSSAFWENHGQFVRCVVQECGSLVKSRDVDGATCNALIVNAAHSEVGKRSKRRSPGPPTEP